MRDDAVASDSRQARPIDGTLRSSNLPIVLVIAALLVGMAALLPLVQSSRVTTTGGSIRQLEQEKQDWQARLQEQEVKVAQLGSLARIEAEAAARFKMVKPKDVRYVRIDAPAPAPHRLPSRFAPADHAAPENGGSLWQNLTGWLPLP
jgi:cell division protein FtsL